MKDFFLIFMVFFSFCLRKDACDRSNPARTRSFNRHCQSEVVHELGGILGRD